MENFNFCIFLVGLISILSFGDVSGFTKFEFKHCTPLSSSLLKKHNQTLVDCIINCYGEIEKYQFAIFDGPSRCYCLKDLISCKRGGNAKKVYFTKSTTIVEKFKLTSSLVSKDSPISFIGKFKTQIKQHPPHLPIKILYDNTVIKNYTIKEISPKEALFTFQHSSPSNGTLKLLVINFTNSNSHSVNYTGEITLIPKDEIQFSPDYLKFGDSIANDDYIKKVNQRHLSNGSFAMLVHERLDFNYNSSVYTLYNVSITKRLDYPKTCIDEGKSWKKVGVKCQNLSSPILKVNQNKTRVSFIPRTTGLYTIMIHIRNKNSGRDYYQTVPMVNYLIAEEKIIKVCPTIYREGNNLFILYANVEGPTTKMNVVYQWSHSSSRYLIKTELNQYKYTAPSKSLRSSFAFVMMAYNLVSVSPRNSFFETLYKDLKAAYVEKKENPILVNEIISLNASAWGAPEWIFNPDSDSSIRSKGRLHAAQQYDKPGHWKINTTFTLAKEKKTVQSNIFVLDKIKPLDLHYMNEEWNASHIYLDFRMDWYNATFFNTSYNPIFSWTFHGLNTTNVTDKPEIEQIFPTVGVYEVDVLISNIISTYSTSTNVYIRPEICYKNLKLFKYTQNKTLIFTSHDTLDFNPFLFVKCENATMKDVDITWTVKGFEDQPLSKCLNLFMKTNNKLLPTGNSTLNVQVTLRNMTTTRSVYIAIQEKGPVVVISPGGARKMSKKRQVTLKATRLGPQWNNYIWKCYVIKNGIGKIEQLKRNCFDKFGEEVKEDQPEYTFNPSNLVNMENLKYLISVQVENDRKNQRSAVDYVYLEFQDSDITESFDIICETCITGTTKQPSNLPAVFKLKFNKDTITPIDNLVFSWSFEKHIKTEETEHETLDQEKQKCSHCVRFTRLHDNCDKIAEYDYGLTQVSEYVGPQQVLSTLRHKLKKKDSFPSQTKGRPTKRSPRGTAFNNNIPNLESKNRKKSNVSVSTCGKVNCSDEFFLFSKCVYNYDTDFLANFDNSGVISTSITRRPKNQTFAKKTNIPTTRSVPLITTTTKPKYEEMNTEALYRLLKNKMPTRIQEPYVPLGSNQPSIIIDSGGFTDDTLYWVKVVAFRKDDPEKTTVGETKIPFNTKTTLNEGECSFQSMGYGLEKQYRIICEEWSGHESLLYEVQWLNPDTKRFETIQMTQTYQISFYLPHFAANKTKPVFRMIIEKKDGFRMQLCPIALQAERHLYDPKPLDYHFNMIKEDLEKEFEHPSIVANKVLAMAMILEQQNYGRQQQQKFVTGLCEIVYTIYPKVMPNFILVVMNKLVQFLDHTDEACLSYLWNTVIDIVNKVQDEDQCYISHFDYTFVTQRTNYNNHLAEVYAKLLHLKQMQKESSGPLDQSRLQPFIKFLNERKSIFGEYMNFSTDYFRAVGKTTVSREESCHMLKSSSIQVENNNKSLTSDLKFTMTSVGQGEGYLIYANAKHHSYNGIEREKITDATYAISQEIKTKQPVYVYQVTKNTAIRHKIKMVDAKFFYIFIQIEATSHNSFYYDFRARVSRVNEENKYFSIDQNEDNVDLFQRRVNVTSDLEEYVIITELRMKEKLFKMVEGEVWFNYTISFEQPICDTEESVDNRAFGKPLCEAEQTRSSLLICRCKGEGFIKSNINYIQSEFHTVLRESTGSLLPISILCSLIVLYIVVILARFWQVNHSTVPIIDIPENYPCDPYRYFFIIETGHCIGAGTSARVCAILYGEQGHSQKVELTQANKHLFERSSTNLFIMSCPKHLGMLTRLTIWHNNTNQSADWYIKQITVKDTYENKEYYFSVNNWLSLSKGLMSPHCALDAYTKPIRSKAKGFLENLLDYYIPVSLFFGPKYSNFDYFERSFYLIASILYYFMVTIVIFKDNVASNAHVVSVFHIQSSDIFWIAFLISLSYLPIGLVLSCLFRCSLKHPEEFGDYYSPRKRFNNKIGSIDSTHYTFSTTTSSQGALFYTKVLEDQISRRSSQDGIAWRFQLPYRSRTLAWIITMGITLISGALIWLKSVSIYSEFIMSWVQLAFLATLIEVFIVGSFLAIVQSVASLHVPFWGDSIGYFFHRMSRHVKDDEHMNEYQKAVMARDRSRFIRYADVMSVKEIKKKQKRAKKRLHVKQIYRKSALLIVLFLIVLGMTCLSHNRSLYEWDQELRRNITKNTGYIQDYEKWFHNFKKFAPKEEEESVIYGSVLTEVVTWDDGKQPIRRAFKQRNPRTFELTNQIIPQIKIANVTYNDNDVTKVVLSFLVTNVAGNTEPPTSRMFYSYVQMTFRKFKKKKFSDLLFKLDKQYLFKLDTHTLCLHGGESFLSMTTLSLLLQLSLLIVSIGMTLHAYSRLLERGVSYITTNLANV
eukprot:TCONS_00023932-protein